MQKDCNHMKDDCSTPKLLCFSLIVHNLYDLWQPGLKDSGLCNQPQSNHINNEFNQDLHSSLLMGGHDFMWITEVENRNAHDILE